MTDLSTQDIEKRQRAYAQAWRVAYTLNNTQPVQCTIIGEDPLFYMDESGILEDTEFDEALLESVDGVFLEQDLQKLKREIAQLERLAPQESRDEQNLSALFSQNADALCRPFVSPATDIQPLLDILIQSRSAASYLECAAQHNIALAYSLQVREAHYDRQGGPILINPTYTIGEQILLTIRELRRHWQHRKGALVNPLSFAPDHAVMINRLQTADLCTAMVRVAWELQLAGQRDAWSRIEDSSLADLGRAFAREAFLDFRTLNNGMASTAAFESWFLSERCRAEDRVLIKQMLADYQGYIFDLGQAAAAIKPALIVALGEVPVGKNYLAQHATTILTDPIFTDVRDRSNANFLWFIKFERSFRETEQALQMDPLSPPDGIRRPGSSIKTKDYPHASLSHPGPVTDGAEIITLAPFIGAGTQPRRHQKKAGQSQNVIYLRRWPEE
ncbi:MAG: hypothetical protein L6Q57_02135 [Alphaproteobacteria bacterium]|nr:hypothetical protein [Alphaproteobacteria bacterium]